MSPTIADLASAADVGTAGANFTNNFPVLRTRKPRALGLGYGFLVQRQDSRGVAHPAGVTVGLATARTLSEVSYRFRRSQFTTVDDSMDMLPVLRRWMDIPADNETSAQMLDAWLSNQMKADGARVQCTPITGAPFVLPMNNHDIRTVVEKKQPPTWMKDTTVKFFHRMLVAALLASDTKSEDAPPLPPTPPSLEWTEGKSPDTLSVDWSKITSTTDDTLLAKLVDSVAARRAAAEKEAGR